MASRKFCREVATVRVLRIDKKSVTLVVDYARGRTGVDSETQTLKAGGCFNVSHVVTVELDDPDQLAIASFMLQGLNFGRLA